MDNSFDKFIDIERDTKILDYTFNSENFLMWPVVRYMVFSKATGQYDSNVSRLRILKRDLLRYFILNSVKYPHFITNKDIVSFGTTLDNIMTNGKYFNRIHTNSCFSKFFFRNARLGTNFALCFVDKCIFCICSKSRACKIQSRVQLQKNITDTDSKFSCIPLK